MKPLLLAPWNAYHEMAHVNLSPDGFLDAQADPHSVRSFAKGNLARIAAISELHPTVENISGILTLAQLARVHGFDFYLVHGPAWEGLQNEEAYWRGCEILDEIATEAPKKTTVIRPHKSFFSETVMQDDVHLTFSSASEYSKALSLQIQNIEGY